jgi:cell shape-determining protein MreD
MWKSIGNTFFLIIVGISLALISFSFSSSLPSIAQHFNPGLILIMFILFFLGFKSTIKFIFIFGITLDILYFQFFGVYTISLIIASLASVFVLNNFLTNKSLYSLIATIIIFTLTYTGTMAILDFIFSGFRVPMAFSQAVFWQTIIYQIMWGVIAAILFFHLLVAWFNKFKPFFLENKQPM